MPYPFRRRPRTKEESPTFAHLPHGGLYKACLDFGSDSEIAALAEIEELDEEVRLLYVALTRAKYRCYIGLPEPDQNMLKSAIARILPIGDIENNDSLYEKLSSTLPPSMYQVEKILNDTIKQFSPTRLLCPICTRLSILVPRAIRVSANVPRSTQAQAPTST